jgi:predicted dehydrogenase
MQAINTALLSFGMSGQVFHAPFIDVHTGFHLHSVWERSKNAAVKKYVAVKTYRTLEVLLEDGEIELVVVNTPNKTHYEFAKKALEHGKHVIVEKPFTVNVSEGEELIKLAKKKNKLLTVYQNRRYDSDYKTVKEVLEKGSLGNIVEAEFHYDRFKKELSAKQHKEIPEKGTGALYDLGSHLVDQALQLFGKPNAIFADIQKIRPHSQVDDYFELLLYYDGLRVRLRSSYLVREALPGYVVHGDKGSFIKNKTDVQEKALVAGRKPGGEGWGTEPTTDWGLLHTEIDGQLTREHIPSITGNYTAFYDSVYNAIRSGAPPPILPQESMDVIRIIEAAFQSNEERKVIAFKW